MKKKNLFLILTCLISFATACTYNNVYLNKKEDQEEGTTFIGKFYSKINTKDYKALNQMTSDTLKRLAGPDVMSKMAKFVNAKVGDYKSFAIVENLTKDVTGSNPETFYNFKVKVVYDKGTVHETIGLRKQLGKITINYYHANSDLLLR